MKNKQEIDEKKKKMLELAGRSIIRVYKKFPKDFDIQIVLALAKKGLSLLENNQEKIINDNILDYYK